MLQHCNPNRSNAHTQPPEPLTLSKSRDGFWTCAVTPAARDDGTNAMPPSSRENTQAMELSRQSQPPCPAHPLATYSRPGVEVSGDVVRAREPHRIEPTMHMQASSLDVTPHDEDHRDQHKTDSIWSRISSVSRKGFARIYTFLIGSRDGETIPERHSRHFTM
jgi:hypothetical protein